MDLKGLLGDELYAQVNAVLTKNADVSLLIDSKKEPTFLPKSRFDEVNGQRKQYKEQNDQLVKDIDLMKTNAKGNEQLTADLEKAKLKLQDTETLMNKQMKEVRLDAEIKIALTTGKAKNQKLVSSLLDKEKITINAKGEIEGLEEQLKALTETDSYLFDTEKSDDKGEKREDNKENKDPNDKTDLSGGTGKIGSGGKDKTKGGKVESIGAMLARKKSEAHKSDNPGNFFGDK